MNLRAVAEAVAAYKEGAGQADAARLDFFEKLYRLQQERADELGACFGAEPLGQEEAREAYLAFRPLLAEAPVAISSAQLAETCRRIAAHLVSEAGLDEDVARALGQLSWDDFTAKLDVELAGARPPEFVEACLKGFDSFEVASSLPASIVMMVVSFALRAHIQTAAEQLFACVGKDVAAGSHARPVNCPICGSPAALSHVYMASGIDGRDREQYCSMCGTVWPYERMRCGVCGVDNPSRLHYFHVEGDEAHRLQNCDECGQYQRVFFEESLAIPVSLEVEDVVMAKLDQIALDPRFRA